MCEWLSEECVSRHAVLVPGIMALINDAETQRSACTALDALLEILHDHIPIYLSSIMECLNTLLATAPIAVKSVVIGAIGSAAHAAKDGFMPYFQPTMEQLQHFLVLTGEGEEVELRGITVDAIGTFAEAVGKDVFRPYFPEMMKQAFQGLELGSPRLRECSFLFFGVMAKVFEDEFAPFLANVVPPLLKSCSQVEQGEELSVVEASSAFGTGTSPQNAITIMDEKVDVNGNDMVEIEDLDVEKMMDANSAIAVEKEIAADTLGTLFAATKLNFLPYVESCAMQLIDLLPHYYEGIRKSATDSLLEIVRTFYDISDHPEWQAGLNYTPLPSTVKDLNEHALKALLEMYETEDNKSVVTTLCNSLAETINKIGPGFVDGHLEEISKLAMEILDQKAECQQDPDQDDDEEAPEDQAEYETVLISSAGDVVAALANALGADFAPAFPAFFASISKYYKKSRSLNERSSTIGCLAEIISGMKGAITPSTEPLLELCHKALSDSEADVLSNAAFAVGLLVENTDRDLTAQYLQLLGALRPLFNVQPDSPPNVLNARDNAAGAVARMIVRNVAAVPLDQVLPVLVAALPLRNDLLENRPVFRALFFLFRTNGAALHPYIGNLLPVFAHVLDPDAPDQLGDEIRMELIQLIGALNAQDPGAIQAAGLGVFVPGQPYSWSFSPATWTSTTGDIGYRVSSLPSWLSFDPATRTLSGTPTARDEGNPFITVTAHDSESSVSSSFTLCVTPYPAPTLHTSVADQFYDGNPSLSSVFLLSPHSALETPDPALRIPPSWSFSIGFAPDTFSAENSLFYYALQADGSPPPEWMEFNSKILTLNGVVPHNDGLESPSVISLVLHGSDQEGYSAQRQPFDIIIAAHDLGQLNDMPTINVTQSTPFKFSLASYDFSGIFIDEKQPITLPNISFLSIDTSACDWVAFDNASWILSGNPPSDLGTTSSLPLTIGSSFNQVLQTNMSLAVVKSYFATPSCSTLTIGDDREVKFDLTPYFSDTLCGDATLSAAFSPEGDDYLSFDPTSATLSGTIPDTSSVSQIDVTFTAYCHLLHSTSHITLPIAVLSASATNTKGSHHPINFSTAAHKKLVLAFGIMFSVIGVVCALGAFFALFRRCARVEDTAKAGNEGLSDSDKKWYGVVDEEKGYGSSLPRSAMEIENPFGPGTEPVTPVRGAPEYGALGLGLRRVAERSGSDPISNASPGSSRSPGVMRKGEFLTRLRQTARNVSEKYGSRRKTSATRPIIGKPTLIVPEGLPYDDIPDGFPYDGVQGSPNPFDDSNIIRSHPGSTVITNSPSTSTGEHSIPRRRADFAPPRSPAAVHFQEGLVRELSSGSLSSNEEAVIQVASKATSIRSGMSQHHSAGPARPRLVPFTSAARVPVPRVPSLSVEEPSGSPSRRVTSQRAVVLKEDGVNRSPTADELSVGIHYVRSLGHPDVNPDPSTPTVSTHVRSSYSSLESSHHGHAAAGIMRTLVRTGEKFNFRVPVSLYSAASYKRVRKLEAKLMSGKPLPQVPAWPRDLGEFSVGIYTVDDGACVGRVVVEVVAASR
ncbi:Importin N-terminal domain-containing protein [Mycena sanguinolenta]|uniref:Importin N-terminal domain-containing protein n=1 Tax=Mycena sanguinolenta TaxID=230812 RepID=A0A8H6Z7I0_9AGAR|nr:Importin N-terminal domain-containing protein [Mycena sanguinolenta]